MCGVIFDKRERRENREEKARKFHAPKFKKRCDQLPVQKVPEEHSHLKEIILTDGLFLI